MGMVSPVQRPPTGGHPLSTVYSFVPIPGAQQHKRPRRRYEEIERMCKCGWNGCEKAYGTLNHLNAHVTMQSHGPKRTPEEFKEIRKEWKTKRKLNARQTRNVSDKLILVAANNTTSSLTAKCELLLVLHQAWAVLSSHRSATLLSRAVRRRNPNTGSLNQARAWIRWDTTRSLHTLQAARSTNSVKRTLSTNLITSSRPAHGSYSTSCAQHHEGLLQKGRAAFYEFISTCLSYERLHLQSVHLCIILVAEAVFAGRFIFLSSLHWWAMMTAGLCMT